MDVHAFETVRTHRRAKAPAPRPLGARCKRAAMRGILLLLAIPAGWLFAWLVSGLLDYSGPVKAKLVAFSGGIHQVIELLGGVFH